MLVRSPLHVTQQISLPELHHRARKWRHFCCHTILFSFCHRMLGGLEMTRVCCFSNSSTKCCFPITIYLGNCLSHYLYPNCLKQMVLYTLNSSPSHFNHHRPVIWDCRPEREKYVPVTKYAKMSLIT